RAVPISTRTSVEPTAPASAAPTPAEADAETTTPTPAAPTPAGVRGIGPPRVIPRIVEGRAPPPRARTIRRHDDRRRIVRRRVVAIVAIATVIVAVVRVRLIAAERRRYTIGRQVVVEVGTSRHLLHKVGHDRFLVPGHTTVRERIQVPVIAGHELVELEGLSRERDIDHADRKSTRLNSSHANISYAV